MERLFTPAEANAALDQVRPLAEALVEARASMLAAAARRAELRGQVAGNGGGIDPAGPRALEEAFDDAVRDVARALGELDALGVLVKDPDAGLLDFPSQRGGEIVLLCWQLGEPEVAYWHPLEEGFAGRKPI